MRELTDKEQFSERLKFAIKQRYKESLKTSDIANRFNLRHKNESVTQQAVHRWLNGQSIPTQDKIQTLAEWLNVSEEWLKHGVNKRLDGQELTALDEMMLKHFGRLSEKNKKLLIELAKELEQ